MYLGSYENLQGFSLFHVSHIYFWDWWLEFMKLFKNDYVRLDVKWSPIHRKGSQKFTFGASISTLKGSQFRWKSCAESFIPIESHHVIHLMISVRLKFVFNHLPRPLHFCLCTSLSVKLPREWWILLDTLFHKFHDLELLASIRTWVHDWVWALEAFEEKGREKVMATLHIIHTSMYWNEKINR